MNVGQVMLNPALIGAGLGGGVGMVQKYGHDNPGYSVTDSIMTGAEIGLGLGAGYVAIKTGFASKKVGYLTNPFKSGPSVDTTGMTAQQIQALKMFGVK
jgi:hypothetical protein